MKRWAGFGFPGARVHQDYADAEIARITEAAEAGDWPAVRDQLAAHPEEADRTWLLNAVAGAAGVERWIPKALAAEPDSALPLLVAGARHVSWGWEARTGATADHVSREQFAAFHERLRVAEDWLYQAAEREPTWASPWYCLQKSGRGLQVGPAVARRRFEAAVRRHPHHLGAHQQQLQQLCAKWSGSHEEMHAFARRSVAEAPGGSWLGKLVAVAHIEHWLSLDDGPDTAYIQRPEVVAELREAAEHSIWHPGFDLGQAWVQVHNAFALAFSLAGDRDSARRCFEATHGIVTPFPWEYVDAGDPAEPYRRYRAAAG
ncbi:hypothetical protein C6N75_25225 [Streptomyces solincola]|uniref:DUF4034 domain-containing protein n=1 Tax=Streptomyces solincola TaxID=2100817 RepID=A0A2S9PQ49_9ACTN|nr:hypothetical protein C6N75_25225 [Streptomyces solincola]